MMKFWEDVIMFILAILMMSTVFVIIIAVMMCLSEALNSFQEAFGGATSG